jgi:DNA invertase Pin-like site-specific DNA recombinase
LETVRQFREDGLSLRKIAAKVHTSLMTVQRIIQREQTA